MDGFELFNTHHWKPFSYIGFSSPLLYVNAHTLIFTWIVLALLLVVGLYARSMVTAKKSIAHWVFSSITKSFFDMTEQSLGEVPLNHCVFAASLFIFIFFCNILCVIPWLEEPTKDLSTTLGLGILSFIYVQFYAIKSHGIIGYVKEFFSPLFIMFPLNVVGKFTTIISISFRLFGNIFGGAIILTIYQSFIQQSILTEILGIGPNLLLISFFGIAEAFIQAFVFAMLALAYLAIGIQGELPEEISSSKGPV